MPPTLGIHWIVTTHGSWLHGDPRGSWKNGRRIGPDPFLEKAIRARIDHDAIRLNDVERMLISAVWGVAVREWGLRIYAATIRPTHAHTLFAPMRRDVDDVIAGLKRRSAAAILALKRNMNAGAAPTHLWSARPFVLYINTESHLHNAIRYIRNHNTRTAHPPDPYDWITPLSPPPTSLPTSLPT